MLATEHPTSPAPDRDSHAALETQPHNERMRHVPTIEWIVQKLDADLRRKVHHLWLSYADLPASDPRHPALEAEYRALCRSLDRIADAARRHRPHPHPPNELGNRVTWTISQTIQTLNAADHDTFGRRFPFHTGERSNAEPLWSAMLAVIAHVQKLVELTREIDPDIDERIYEGLVQLREPLRREPIA